MTAPAQAPAVDPLTAAVKEAGKATPPEAPPAAPAPEKPAEKQDEAPAVEEDPGPAIRDDGKPFTAKDHTALNEALKKARKEARDSAAELTRLKEATGGKDVSEALKDADTRAHAKFKPLMVKAAARAAFVEAGLTLPAGRIDEVFARAVKLLDLEALTITDDGLVEGLGQQIEGIRADFPDLFSNTRKAPRLQVADKPAGAAPPATSANRLAEALLGKGAP